MSDEDSNSDYGPSLPPSLIKSQVSYEGNNGSIGPTMPKEFRKVLENHYKEARTDSESDSEDEIIGPTTFGTEENEEKTKFQNFLYQKSQDVDDGKQKREEWMTTLPDKQKSQSKAFKRKNCDTGHFIDESWTKTPGEKPKKKILTKSEQFYKDALEQQYNETQKIANEETRSLLEIHQEEILKKRKEDRLKGDDKKPKERIPFDRENDLKVRQISKITASANKKNFMCQNNTLATKFMKATSSGHPR